MTSKISVFVLVAVSVFGALVGACGDGEISGMPRSPGVGPLDVNEPTPPGPIDGEVPVPGVTGVPFGHVTPASIGVTIGVGVVAPAPTEVYTGPSTITTQGTTIENKIIDSAIEIQASNVTIRNCIIDNGSGSATRTVRIGTVCDPPGCTIIDNILVEYSRVHSRGGNIKQFGINNATNVTIRNNDSDGGADLFQNNRELDGLLVENNTFRGLNGSSNVHYDGIQIGSSCQSPCFVSGTMTFRGNYFEDNRPSIPDSYYNDIFFGDSGGGNNDVEFIAESNYLSPWGKFTFRCYDNASCVIRYNVYGGDMQNRFENYSGSGPKFAMLYSDNNAAASVFDCNRYEASGEVIPEQYLVNDTGSGPVGTYVGSGCPSY